MSTKLPDRLYTVRLTAWPDEALEWVPATELTDWENYYWDVGARTVNGVEERAQLIEGWEPEGWEEFATDKFGLHVVDAETGERDYPDFFWPKVDKIWRSRSSAQNVVNIIESWGGSAVILETTPIWEPIEDANARRRRERNAPTIAKLRARIKEMESA